MVVTKMENGDDPSVYPLLKRRMATCPR